MELGLTFAELGVPPLAALAADPPPLQSGECDTCKVRIFKSTYAGAVPDRCISCARQDNRAAWARLLPICDHQPRDWMILAIVKRFDRIPIPGRHFCESCMAATSEYGMHPAAAVASIFLGDKICGAAWIARSALESLVRDFGPALQMPRGFG